MKAGGMEWALMDIGVELRWQGRRLGGLHTERGAPREAETNCGHAQMQRMAGGSQG